MYSFFSLNTKYVSRLTTVLKFRILNLDINPAQKLKFSLTIPSVNVTKYAVFCGIGHVYRRNLEFPEKRRFLQ